MNKKNSLVIVLAIIIALVVGMLGGNLLTNALTEKQPENNSSNKNDNLNNNQPDKNQNGNTNKNEIPSDEKIPAILKAAEIMSNYKIGDRYFRFTDYYAQDQITLILSNVGITLDSCDKIFKDASNFSDYEDPFNDIDYLRESCKLLEKGYDQSNGMTEVYSYDKLLERKKDLFGPKSEIKKERFFHSFNDFVYVKHMNSFVTINCNCGADGPVEASYRREYIYDAVETNNEFYVYLKVLEVAEILDSETYEPKPNEFSKIEEEYKYTFVKNNNDNDGYYLSKTEKIS